MSLVVDGNGVSNHVCFSSGKSSMWVESLRCDGINGVPYDDDKVDGDNTEGITTLFYAILRRLSGKTGVCTMGRPIVV